MHNKKNSKEDPIEWMALDIITSDISTEIATVSNFLDIFLNIHLWDFTTSVCIHLLNIFESIWFRRIYLKTNIQIRFILLKRQKESIQVLVLR